MKNYSIIFFLLPYCFVVSCNEVSFSENSDACSKYKLQGEVKQLEVFEEEINFCNLESEVRRMDKNYPYPDCLIKFDKNGMLEQISDEYRIRKYVGGKLIEERRPKHYSRAYDKLKYDDFGNIIERYTIREDPEFDEVYDEYIRKDYDCLSDTLKRYNYHRRHIYHSDGSQYESLASMEIRYMLGKIVFMTEDLLPSTSDLGNLEPYFDDYSWFGSPGTVFREKFVYNDQKLLRQKRSWADSTLLSQTTIEYNDSNLIEKIVESGGRRIANGDLTLDDWTWSSVGYVKKGEIIYNPDVPTVSIHYVYNERKDIQTAEVFVNDIYGNENGTLNYTYEYDKYGNWVTCMIDCNGKLCSVLTRKIKYFNGDRTEYTASFSAGRIADAKYRIKQEEAERKQRESHIASHPLELSFNNAEFYELYGRVFAKFEATVTNVSDRIFIDCHWTDPRVVMRFNKDYVLTARIFGSNVSYDNPWKPGEKRTISIFCDRPEDEYITVGFKDFFPKLSLLLFDITVEDSDGEKTTMPFTYDIRTCWDAYVNKSGEQSEQTQQSEQQEQPKEKAVLEF